MGLGEMSVRGEGLQMNRCDGIMGLEGRIAWELYMNRLQNRFWLTTNWE